MGAFRRLTRYFRSERRSKRSCPYSRPPPRPSISIFMGRDWDFFGFFSIFTPYIDEGDEEEEREVEALAFAFDRDELLFGSDKESVSTETDSSASSCEGSTTTATTMTSDTSVETVETAETTDDFESVPAKISEPERPSQPAKPMETMAQLPPEEPFSEPQKTVATDVPIVSSDDAPCQQFPSIATPPSSSQPVASDNWTPSSTTEPLVFTNDDDLIEWVKGKVERREKMSNADYLTFKMFFETTRRELQHEPIKLKFMPRHSSPASVPPPVHPSPITPQSASDPSPSADSSSSPTADAPSYISGFHSSNALPPFKNNVRAARPPKVLKEDPNGTYEWRGAGSARNTEDSRKRKAPSVIPRFDPYKRQKLFAEARGPIMTSSVATFASETSTEPVYSVFGEPSQSSANHRHSAPHVPSPSHNVVNRSSPPSSPRSSLPVPTNLNATGSGRVPPNQTASAAILQEIVEKVTPRRPRYSDIVNPYQSAAPVKPIIKPMEKRRISERRARAKDVEKECVFPKSKEPEKRELSAREIIEATIPKGAKRSRPPPGLGRSRDSSALSGGSTIKRPLEDSDEELVQTKRRRTVTIEDVAEDDEVRERSFPARPNVIIESRSPSPEPTSSRSRSDGTLASKETSTRTSLRGAPKAPPIAPPPAKEASIKATGVRESTPKVPIAKEQGQKPHSSARVSSSKDASVRTSTKGPSGKGPSNHFSPLLNSKVTGKSSVPREPSKLRTSFLPDECENEEPKMASPAPPSVVVMTTPGTPLADIQEKKDPKEVALTLPLNDLPSFIFKTPPVLLAGDHTDARVAAKELPVTSLPKFDFSKARTSVNGLFFPAVPIPTIKAVDLESARVKPSTSSSNGQWQCSTCMLQNSAPDAAKCSTCEAPRPGSEKWKNLSMNGVTNSSVVNGKSHSPKSTPTSSISSDARTFDFAAAGLKPKEPIGNGQWTCSVCLLQNPPTAVEKCSVCDSPRPGAEKTERVGRPKESYINGSAQSTRNLTNGSSLPAKSFDFVPADPKPAPTPGNGSWYCFTCMLQNPATATERCKVCDSPRPGLGNDKKVASLPVVSLKPAPQLVPKSFDWVAAGMIPKFKSTSWTCGTCMLSNPPTETEKCKVCDASRS